MRDNPGGWGAVVAAYLRNTGGGDDDEGSEERGEDSGGGMAVVSGLGLVVTALSMISALMLFG
jgi:hypothetical protein